MWLMILLVVLSEIIGNNLSFSLQNNGLNIALAGYHYDFYLQPFFAIKHNSSMIVEKKPGESVESSNESVISGDKYKEIE